MSDLEDRLRDALRAEADRRPVDLAALRQRVDARLSGRPPRRSGRTSRAAVPLLAAAAATAAVAGTVAVVDRLDRPDRLGPDDPVGTRQVQGGVDDRFVCPSRGRTVFDADNTDDSFLPELTPDLRPAGEAATLPRYELDRVGDRVRVRFGGTDGTLASVVVFRPVAGGWEPARLTKCTNGPGPRGPDAVADTPPPGSGGPDQFTAADFPTGAVKLFDAVTYDVNGLALLQSAWAEPCGRTVCLVAGKTTSYVRGRLHPDDSEPSDATAFLYSPDTIVGQRTGYRLIVCYAREDHSLVAVSWRTRNGEAKGLKPVVGGWQGALFTMVVPRDDFAGVTLHRIDGTEFFPADQIRQ